VLFAIDLHEHFINEECVAVSSVLSLQTPCIFGTEFVTQQPDGFIADSDASFGQEIFNITMAEVEMIITPDGITDDVGWESVTLLREVGLRNAGWAKKFAINYPRACFFRDSQLRVFQ